MSKNKKKILDNLNNNQNEAQTDLNIEENLSEKDEDSLEKMDSENTSVKTEVISKFFEITQEEYLTKLYESINQFSEKGFRPGKTPVVLFQIRYSQKNNGRSFLNDFINETITRKQYETFYELMSSNNIENIEVKSIEGNVENGWKIHMDFLVSKKTSV